MDGLSLGSSDDLVLIVVVASLLALLVLGVLERRRHTRSLTRIPVRLSVNGSRGKSTVTRLLTGALSAGGVKTLGKTTGTEPMLLLGWSGEEESIRRRPEGPNIGEQRHVVRRAADERADVLVSECMAVDPEYQLTFHRQLLDCNLLVICNALEDHLDEMGPTVDDVAEVFAASIPERGTVVVIPDRHLDTYRAVAQARDTKLIVADPSAIDDEQLRGFGHLVLPDHVALVLAVTRHLGVDDTVAMRGMRATSADPYAMHVVPIGDARTPGYFVNGFAANDPHSTLAVWEHLQQRDLDANGLTVVVNCRADRMSRTQLFATEVLPALPMDTLVVTGQQTRPILRAARTGRLNGARVVDCTDATADEVVRALDGTLANRIVYGVGNLHGGGVELVEALEDLAVGPSDDGRLDRARPAGGR